MGKRMKCLVCVLLLLLLVCEPAMGALGRTREDFIQNFAAWRDGERVRLQFELREKFDQVEVAVAAGDETESVEFRNSDRISIAAEGVTSSALIQLRAFEAGELAETALFRAALPEDRDNGSGDKIALRKSSWEKKREEEPLPLIPIAADEVERPSALDKRAKSYYKRVYGDDNPEDISKGERNLSPQRMLDTFELEPNDTKGKADWLYSGKDAYGRIGVEGDLDYWKIKAPTKESQLKVWLGEMPVKQDYDLYLYDEEGRELAKSVNQGTMDELIEGFAAERGSWFYILVKGKGDDADRDNYYHLRAEFLPPGVVVKPDEYESNNTPADAAMAKNFETIEATIHALDDVDYYKYQFELASTLDLTLAKIPEGMDLDLYLLDSNLKVLAKSENARNHDEHIVYNGDPGTYYVKVAASRSSVITYHQYELNGTIRTMPVILIPGIGGSRLSMVENGRVSNAWLDEWNIPLDNMIPIHRRVLTLTPKVWGGVEVEQRDKRVKIFPEVGDYGLHAIEYLSYNFFDSVKELSEQYYSMSEHLQKMGYQKGITLFGFPYDWRLSNVNNAKQLMQLIDEALRISQAKQVQLVVHSMGGILARETLLSNPSYQGKTKRVIYMGTPFIGSPRAYQSIKFGYNFGIILLNPETIRQVSEFSPAVYELLPSRLYTEKHPYLLETDGIHENAMPYNTIFTNPTFQLPYLPLAKQAERNHDRWDKKKLNVPQYSIIGQGQLTFLGYKYYKYLRTLTPFHDNALGDGTVPFDSANYDAKDIRKKYYVTEEHAQLPRNPYVIQQVAHLLLGIEKAQPHISETPGSHFPYNYYMIYREDGKIPEITVKKGGRLIDLSNGEEISESGMRIETHGNVIVIQMPVDESAGFRDAARIALTASDDQPPIVVRHYFSDGKRSTKGVERQYTLHGSERLELK
ncbi:esterase [Brevibacillus sp. SYP-B805]|uniref:lipase/acyltransferase domain-containing protein n=1 Tax=Brevibacillus sp. SYP-B805 TaxID=1578199 RepID=UPI0013EA6007|nr:pre-peptidase C-terminal domain-containing protein [Brevibacillus sp. SYP-B805]NGQ96209.1 esterase [Brevibacillus sp. SYP-B805]